MTNTNFSITSYDGYDFYYDNYNSLYTHGTGRYLVKNHSTGRWNVNKDATRAASLGRRLLKNPHTARAYYDIYSCYERPSAYKINAWRRIKEFANMVNGRAYITGYNCMQYTAVVVYWEGVVCWSRMYTKNGYCDAPIAYRDIDGATGEIIKETVFY